jgi:SAM-dependent methyltransferase
MSEAWQTKFGNFDWLCDFASVEEFFSSSFTGVHTRGVAGHEPCECAETAAQPPSRALVVGCGTSDLSFQLAHLYDHIISVDYDPEIIKHMTLAAPEFKAKENFHLGRMDWLVCDMLDLEVLPRLLSSQNIDIAIDKGSFDAMIVEGSIVNLFVNIHRMLRRGGKYLVISLLSKELLQELLNIPYFFEVDNCAEKIFPSGKVTVIICRKVVSDRFENDTSLMKRLEEHEKSITDKYFQQSNPWLTEEKKNRVMHFFLEFCASKNLALDFARLPLPIAHNIIESLDPNLGYSYDLFLSDIRNSDMSENCISYTELIALLQNLQ